MIEAVLDCRPVGVPVFDCHGHVGAWPDFPTYQNDIEGILSAMDLMGIRRIAVSSLDAIYSDTERGNPEAYTAAQAHPGRFWAYTVVNPNFPETIERVLEAQPMNALRPMIKIHPAVHRYPADGPNYCPLWEFAQRTAAVVLLLPLSLRQAGGISGVLSRMPDGFLSPFHAPYTPLYVFGFVLLSTLSMAGNWSLVQRFYSARSEKDAVRIGWVAAGLFLALPPFWIFAGMAARVWLPAGWAEHNDTQYVYAEISRVLLRPGLLGLIVAALLAATMSVLSAGYNVIASVLTVDVYQRHIRPGASQRHLLVVGKCLTVLIGATAVAVAWVVLYLRWTLFDTMVAAFGFFVPPTVLPVLAGLIWPRITSRGALAGFFAGLASGGAFLVIRAFVPAGHGYDVQTISIWISSLVVIAAMAAFSHPDEAERERIAAFYRSIARPSAPPSAAAVPEPFFITGLVLVILGLVLAIIGITQRGAGNLAIWIGLLFAAIGGVLLLLDRRARAGKGANPG